MKLSFHAIISFFVFCFEMMVCEREQLVSTTDAKLSRANDYYNSDLINTPKVKHLRSDNLVQSDQTD